MIDSILEQDKINRDPQGFEKYMLELSNLTKILSDFNTGDFVVLENL
jgi:hypothetical protein